MAGVVDESGGVAAATFVEKIAGQRDEILIIFTFEKAFFVQKIPARVARIFVARRLYDGLPLLNDAQASVGRKPSIRLRTIGQLPHGRQVQHRIPAKEVGNGDQKPPKIFVFVERVTATPCMLRNECKKIIFYPCNAELAQTISEGVGCC
uniref:Uncharacterized protein n=1 Tax=Romanomermis culicivorax TaxID=13658 RepID=A0A915INT2_ROMCU